MKDFAENNRETIAAVATAAGKAGVGIVRISGPLAEQIGTAIVGKPLQKRQAVYGRFKDTKGEVLDDGIVLFFPAPASYTGESVVELQGHGSPVILRAILQRVIELGARQAQPGEFTQRAFLNDRLDLAQAEAVSDLIEANSVRAAKAAQRSLTGEFSNEVLGITQKLIELRVQIEAALDFPDEEIELEFHQRVHARYQELLNELAKLRQRCVNGQRLRDGITITVLGPPNAGKSSLINYLSHSDIAIVTDIPGTTRDLISVDIELNGIPMTLFDTAGLRETSDPIEQEGIRRAKQRSETSDLSLWVCEDAAETPAPEEFDQEIWIRNKCDISGAPAGLIDENTVRISAAQGDGIDDLIALLKEKTSLTDSEEGYFTARARHVEGLVQAQNHLQASQPHYPSMAELAAEELRLAQQALDQLTGQFHSDDLLGEIFTNFCIGK